MMYHFFRIAIAISMAALLCFAVPFAKADNTAPPKSKDENYDKKPLMLVARELADGQKEVERLRFQRV